MPNQNDRSKSRMRPGGLLQPLRLNQMQTTAEDQSVRFQRPFDLSVDSIASQCITCQCITCLAHFGSSRNAERQTSRSIISATIARPSSGFFQVKASGMDSFLRTMNSLSWSLMPSSRCGAW